MARRAPASLYARVLRVGAWGRRPARSARPLGVRAASCLLGVCAASFARRVVSKPAPRATRLPSAALRAARLPSAALRAARLPSAALRAARLPSAALRADRSPSVELVFSCLSACWCPGAAARPLAVRAASFARRVVSKPGQALPPPPGTRANTGAWLLALSRPGRVVRRGEPTTERVHRPATASSLGATRRGLCLPSQLRFPLAFGR